MAAPEAVSIEDSFRTISDRLHEAMAAGAGLTADGVTEAVATELGVPLHDVTVAVHKESRLGLFFMSLTGPQKAIAVTMIHAFLAGVTWEQGRRG